MNERLKWYLKTEGLLAPEQAGFRQLRSTDDQATYLSQEIEGAFQEQKLVWYLESTSRKRSIKSGWRGYVSAEELPRQQYVQLDKVLPVQPHVKSLCKQSSQHENSTTARCSTGRNPIPYIIHTFRQGPSLRASKESQNSIICR